MDPITIAALLSGPLASLFGGGGNRLDAATLQKLFGVGALSADTNRLFNLNKQSPLGQFGLENAALQGNLIGSDLARRGAAVGASGIGMLASSAAASTQAFQQGDFLSKLFSQSQDAATSNLNARLAAYTGGVNQPSPTGGLLGSISQALGQYALLNPSKTKDSTNYLDIAKAAIGGDASATNTLRGLLPAPKYTLGSLLGTS